MLRQEEALQEHVHAKQPLAGERDRVLIAPRQEPVRLERREGAREMLQGIDAVLAEDVTGAIRVSGLVTGPELDRAGLAGGQREVLVWVAEQQRPLTHPEVAGADVLGLPNQTDRTILAVVPMQKSIAAPSRPDIVCGARRASSS